ncbi:hypothetical protein [Marivita geojedonensis]|uniref:hypothetical protein n=1 Tax=Marivita geojedonensis TaxID=1123756 RepID=UPI00117F7A2D|nr:hypothetical protein [Marivita geojedonensis]
MLKLQIGGLQSNRGIPCGFASCLDGRFPRSTRLLLAHCLGSLHGFLPQAQRRQALRNEPVSEALREIIKGLSGSHIPQHIRMLPEQLDDIPSCLGRRCAKQAIVVVQNKVRLRDGCPGIPRTSFQKIYEARNVIKRPDLTRVIPAHNVDLRSVSVCGISQSIHLRTGCRF